MTISKEMTVKFEDKGSLNMMRKMIDYFKDVNQTFFATMLLREAVQRSSKEVAFPDVEWEQYHMSAYDVRNFRKGLIDREIAEAQRKWSDEHGANVYHYTIDFDKVEELFGGNAQ